MLLCLRPGICQYFSFRLLAFGDILKSAIETNRFAVTALDCPMGTYPRYAVHVR